MHAEVVRRVGEVFDAAIARSGGASPRPHLIGAPNPVPQWHRSDGTRSSRAFATAPRRPIRSAVDPAAR